MPKKTTKKAKPKCGPLSHSSGKTLLGCHQKYWHYKVNNTKRDSDYVKSDAFQVGSAFHYIQEQGRHEKVPVSALLDHCEKDPDILLAADRRSLVHAMCVKYWRLHKRMGFKVLQVEFELKSEEVIGYVDAIMEDPEGLWWIVDLKTAKTLYEPTLPALPIDPQLNLYASFAQDIADRFDLKVENFGGCRWRVATKPSLKQKAKEDDLEYTKRLINSVKCYDVKVPYEMMNPIETLDRHKELHALSKKLFSSKVDPTRNYGNCMSYFRPCEYWSKCHGGLNYSDTHIEVESET